MWGGGHPRPWRRGRLCPHSSWKGNVESSLVPSGCQIMGVIPPVVSCPIYVKNGGDPSHLIRGDSGYPCFTTTYRELWRDAGGLWSLEREGGGGETVGIGSAALFCLSLQVLLCLSLESIRESIRPSLDRSGYDHSSLGIGDRAYLLVPKQDLRCTGEVPRPSVAPAW